MVYFLNLDGTMTLAEPQRVFQGSNNVNTVYVLSAIAPPTALEISFTLPSGLTTAYYPMIYNGATDEYTVPNTTTTVYLRSFLLTSNITAEVGTVGVSINAVYSNADGTTGNQTSFTGSFNVEYSSIPETVTTGTADELQRALDLLSQYYTQQQAIITGGTNGEYLQSQGDNQLPVWTSFDMDFVTANRAQSFSEEQQAQARENINAQKKINLPPNLAVVSNTDGTLSTAEATTEEVNYLSGVTSDIQTQLDGKQATLTFDDTPTSGSDNPVTSDGIKTFVGEQIKGNCVLFSEAQSLTSEQQAQARENINAQETINLTPNLAVVSNTDGTLTTAEATTEEVNYLSGVKSDIQTQLDGKQETLTFDDTPTSGSDNPVTSDGIKTFVGEQIKGNCVLFSEAQSLTSEQQAQARQNIGAEGSSDTQYFVSVLPQSFTTAQQAQARANINACSPNGDYPNLTAGTATNATNATNDSNGDNIANTYAKQNGTYQNLKAGNSTNSEKSNVLNRTLYSDLNQATEGGTLFYGNSSPNNQNTAMTSAFAGQVLQGGTVANASYLAQKAIHYGGPIAGVDSTVTREYVRGKFGSAWLNWQEIPSIVEDWQSSDGLSWYRIWSNGLKECGGTLTTNSNSTAKSVALPVTYKDTNYKILITPRNLANNAIAVGVKIISVDVNSFSVVGYSTSASTSAYLAVKFDYYCWGY